MISIVFIFLCNTNINLTGLESVLLQEGIDFNIFVCTDDEAYLKSFLKANGILNFEKIYFINIELYNTYLKLLNIINSISKSKYVIFHENTITSNKKRLYEQFNYLELSKTSTCCSCLSNTLSNSNSLSIEACDFENSFITSYEIDQALLGYYIPFSLTSLLIKTNFLLSTMDYLIDDIYLNNKVSFILFLSKYTSIVKLPLNLITYVCFSGYKNYSNKMNLFNISKSIELRNYLKYAIKDTSYKINFCNSDSLRILMILDKANLGGTETYVYSLIKCLLLKGFNVTLASSFGVTYPIIKKLGVKFLNLNYNKDKSLQIIENFILNNNVDLIHCNLENSMFLGKVIKEKYNIPLIVTLHGTFYSHEILKDTCSSANAIISVSKPVDKFIKSLLNNVSTPKYYIVNNGISLDYNRSENIFEKLSLKEDSKLIIYCSRLGVGKGKLALNVLNSLKDLLSIKEYLHLIIIGEGFSKFEIQNHATEFNDSIKRNAIICTGAIYNVKDYFSQASVVIGTGRVIIEALSVNTPSIAYGLEGLLGIITPNNRDEIMDYHFGDHGHKDLTQNKSLVEMVTYILENSNLFKSYAESNYNWCSTNFNEIINTNSIIDIYNFSLNKPPKHSP